MITNFNEQLSIDFDLEIAVLIENLTYWLKFNASKDNPKDRNFREGRYWSFNSYTELAKLFPCWTAKTVRTIIARAVKKGLILIGNFNYKKFDNTNWYTITDKVLEYYPFMISKLRPDSIAEDKAPDSDLHTPAQTGRCSAQTGRPIPISNTSLGNNNIIISDLPDDQRINDDEIVNAYHEELPDCPKIKVVDSKLHSQLKHMRKNWPRYQKDGNKFTIDSFRDYLRYIKQYYPWFVKPYVTENGNTRCNNLRVLTREINITKIVNGEFSAR